MTCVVAIHQPNFFPWLGFFDKIARADRFVLLDDSQFSKTGGNWGNRVKLQLAGEPRWATAPVDRSYSGVRRYCEMEFDERTPWREKLRSSIEQSYRRAPFFAETWELVGPLVANSERNLGRYNIAAIRAIARAVGLAADSLLLSSDLKAAGTSNELLINLTRAANGGTYMCGGGADGYQDEALFAAAGISLVEQGFQHPTYHQASGAEPFVPGLSIVDALMNVGRVGVAEMLGATSAGRARGG